MLEELGGAPRCREGVRPVGGGGTGQGAVAPGSDRACDPRLPLQRVCAAVFSSERSGGQAARPQPLTPSVPSAVKMVQRLTYRRRHSYATKSNKVRKVKTPGGVLTLHKVAKKSNAIKCGDCGSALQG